MTTGSSSNAGPTHKLVEAGVTLLIALFGVIVIVGSLKAGINWGAEGPRAGFFPFYIGIFIVASSAINLWNGLHEDNDGLFAEWGQLRQVMSSPCSVRPRPIFQKCQQYCLFICVSCADFSRRTC